MSIPNHQLIAALDVHTEEDLKKLVEELSPLVGYFKIGLEVGMSIGFPQAVRIIKDSGAKVFVDAKLNDIPNTVAHAVEELARLGVDMTTIHSSVQEITLQQANAAKGKMKLLAVTVLTSMHNDDSMQSFNRPIEEQVVLAAQKAARAGIDGVVCSAREVKSIKNNPETASLITATPGIRPGWADLGDQSRTLTPKQAIAQGSDFLIVGRPITSPPKEVGSPAQAAQLILKEIS